MGFQANYIQRAFKVYEVRHALTLSLHPLSIFTAFTPRPALCQKNYGHSYNVEVITEIIVRLQNKDKTKKGKKEQSGSPKKTSPSKPPPSGSPNKKSNDQSPRNPKSSKSPKKSSKHQQGDNEQIRIQSSSPKSSPSKPRVGGSGGGGGSKHHHSPNQITVKADPPPQAYSQQNYGGSSNPSSPTVSSPLSNNGTTSL